MCFSFSTDHFLRLSGCRFVSRVLFHREFNLPIYPIIYLCDLPILAFVLRRIERVALKPGPIWPFNTRGLPYVNITAYTCELLPHIFTITDTLLWRLHRFCGTLCQNFLSGNMPAFSCGGSPYVARTFLPHTTVEAIEQPAFKVTDFLAIADRKKCELPEPMSL